MTINQTGRALIEAVNRMGSICSNNALNPCRNTGAGAVALPSFMAPAAVVEQQKVEQQKVEAKTMRIYFCVSIVRDGEEYMTEYVQGLDEVGGIALFGTSKGDVVIVKNQFDRIIWKAEITEGAPV